LLQHWYLTDFECLGGSPLYVLPHHTKHYTFSSIHISGATGLLIPYNVVISHEYIGLHRTELWISSSFQRVMCGRYLTLPDDTDVRLCFSDPSLVTS